MAFDLTLEFLLPVKADRLMQLLTDPALIRRWSGEETKLDNKEGGDVELFGGWVKGKVIKTTPRELAYTWKLSEWAEDIKETEVHFLLKEGKDGTTVTVKQTGLPTEEEVNSHKAGWTDYFFEPLEDYIMIFEQ